ncbi:MAG: hypothetical protein LBI84_00695 [Propionibacteriaceae bacterium]|nr:hypothetical protein [Propionibacteriaceae bacterium]
MTAFSGISYEAAGGKTGSLRLPAPHIPQAVSWSAAIAPGMSSRATPTAGLGQGSNLTPQQFSPSSSGTSAPFSVVYYRGNPTPDRTAAGDSGRIRWIHEHTGLTWDQLGRLFGVSRRTVHLWASGSRLNATNAEALAEVERLAHSLAGATPDERRSSLFKLNDEGVSLFDRFLRYRRSGASGINSQPWRALDLLGATADESGPIA